MRYHKKSTHNKLKRTQKNTPLSTALGLNIMTRITLLLSLLIICYPVFSGEGHAWARLSYEGKMLVLTNYDRGYGSGCVNGVLLSTKELFADTQTQLKQYMRISENCTLKYINTDQKAHKIIKIIDTALKVPGAVDIPLPMIFNLAIEVHKKGHEEIPKDEIESWVKSVPNQ